MIRLIKTHMMEILSLGPNVFAGAVELPLVVIVNHIG